MSSGNNGPDLADRIYHAEQAISELQKRRIEFPTTAQQETVVSAGFSCDYLFENNNGVNSGAADTEEFLTFDSLAPQVSGTSINVSGGDDTIIEINEDGFYDCYATIAVSGTGLDGFQVRLLAFGPGAVNVTNYELIDQRPTIPALGDGATCTLTLPPVQMCAGATIQIAVTGYGAAWDADMTIKVFQLAATDVCIDCIGDGDG